MKTTKKLKKAKVEMFLHRKQDGTESLHFGDRSKDIISGQICPRRVAEYGACMGKVMASCEYESIPGDPREKLIEGLEAAAVQERADSQVRVNKLLDQISQLKCLTHEPSKR